ncbi:MAG TPA: glycoside hydrolase family 3 N-terminal domain-containing protein [Gemmatimonadaceae bacterium]|nr:glycoside hydrolase family 3 N-terminal domain-containing protein [Gemmatimonadaceae bacterium]
MSTPDKPLRYGRHIVRRFSFAWSLCATLSCASIRTAAPPAPAPGITARVLVYNIHAGKDAAGADNLAGVAKLVRTSGADVVLLQEVDQGTRRSGGVDQPAVLAARTGMHVAFGSSLDYDGGEYGVAILSRWPIVRDTLIHLPVTPPQQRAGGSYEPRGALRVQIASPMGRLTVIDTHLDPSRDDHWRRQEADTIASLVAQARRSGALVIAGGDFNSTPESAVQAALRDGMRDSWTECAKGDGFTYPADVPVKRIDYLYLGDSIHCRSARVVETRVSDHRPLLVELSFPTTVAGTLDPRTPLTAAQQAWVDSTLASLTLRERVGQMVNVWVLGDYTNVRDSSFAEVLRWIVHDNVGGVSMSLGSPIEVAAKINAMQRAARVPLLVSGDLEPNLGRLEGGVFTHYLMDAGSATVFPNAMAIGATGREEDAYDVGRIIGREARAVGFTTDFAPVVDVNNNPANPVINTRSFGEDPRRVAALSAAFVKGVQDAGIVATLKHFPGHGDTDVDSHVGLPLVDATMARLDTVELVPFAAGIEAGAGIVMTAHIALPAVQGDSTTPATLAPRIITGLLRDSLHFRGLAITDAMTMGGIGKGYTTEESSVLAVKAGADVLLKPTDPTKAIDAVVAAVERGEISRARIDSSVRRVLELKARTGVAFHRFVSLDTLRQIVGAPEHRALAADIATRAVTLLRDEQNLIPVPASGRTVLVQYMPRSELRAGRAFAAEVRQDAPESRVFEIEPATSPARLDSIAREVHGADRVIVATYVRRIEGEGRVAIPTPVASWIDSLAARERVIVVSLGNPYLIRQFPRVGTYAVTYGVSDALERAAARAVLGRASITGTVPVSLPGFFTRGDGIRRDVVAGIQQRR